MVLAAELAMRDSAGLKKPADNIESKAMFLGTFAATPLSVSTFFGNVATVQAAIDCGAKIDQPDDDGITALGWAAIGNMTAVAKLLIEHGADVNHVDKKGMTPLLYAASIDFGDESLVQLLLKSGSKSRSPHERGADGVGAGQEVWAHPASKNSDRRAIAVWEPAPLCRRLL